MIMRQELNECGVVFIEDTHQYFLGDKELQGITTAISECIAPDSLSGIPEHILQKATERGKSIHKSLELFIREWTNDGSKVVASFIDLIQKHDIHPESAEYIVSDLINFASCIDLVSRVDDDTVDLYDYKSFNNLDNDRLCKARMQLSIYKLFFEIVNPHMKVRNLGIIRINEDICELVPISAIDADTCKDLLQCYLEGRTQDFNNPFTIPNDIALLESRIRELMQIEAEAKEELGQIKENLLHRMLETQVKSWQTATMKLTVKASSIRTTLDATKLKKAFPDIPYDDYMKTSTVKESLQITL